MAKSTRSNAERDTIKYLSDNELQALLKAIPNKRDRAIFRLGYHRGLRASEVGLLRMEDLVRSGRDWTLGIRRLKGGKSGVFTLSSVEQSVLRAYIRERGEELGPIFASRKHTPISQQRLDVLMKTYCLAAGVPRDKAHFHTLRHSCATHLLERGCTAEYVQEHLGHRDIKNTLIYMKVSDKMKTDVYEHRLRNWH